MKTKEQKPPQEMYFNAYNINTIMLNNRDWDIIICADSYHNGEPIYLNIVFKDINFLEWISNNEINQIKENLKKRIDQL